MDSAHFDRFTKYVGQHLTRRVAFGPLAVLGLGSLFTLIAETDAKNKERRKGKQRKRQHRKRHLARRPSAGLRLFEELAATLTKVGGDCEALKAAALAFQADNQARIDLIRGEEAGWDQAQRTAQAIADQLRITAAAESLHALLATCGFRGASPSLTSPLCDLPPSGPIDPPGSVACQGCDCGCICPLSGWSCTEEFFGCLFGGEAAPPNCCWFGTCISHLCLQQCPNCCTCCPSAT
jgi:hypothetical protein